VGLERPSAEPTGAFGCIATRFHGEPPTGPADGFIRGIQIDGRARAAVPLPPSMAFPLIGLPTFGGLARARRA
jgi:hypothetical protein